MALLDIVSVGGTLLILAFTSLTFWHQFIRTPRSNVDISTKDRPQPYSTHKSNLTFHAPIAQLSNTGEMVAVIENAAASVEFLSSRTGELLNDDALQNEITVGISSRGRNDELASGSSRRDKASVSIDNISNLPPDFQMKITYEYKISDNLREYVVSDSTEFRFVNEAVKS